MPPVEHSIVEIPAKAVQYEDGVFRLPIEIHTMQRGWVVATPGGAIAFIDPEELIRSVHELVMTYVGMSYADLRAEMMASKIDKARSQSSIKDRPR